MSDEIPMDDAANMLAANYEAEPAEGDRETADKLLTPEQPEEVEETTETEVEHDVPDESQPIEEVEEIDPEPQPIDPPASWSADEKEAFQSLPHEKQIIIAHRERERTAEIRRSQNELAEEKKAFAEERTAFEKEREQYLSAIPKPTPPDEALLEEDPMEYLRQKSKYENDVREHEEAQKELQKTYKEKQEQAQERYATWLKGEQEKLAEILPEYVDEVKGPELRNSLAEYALKEKFTPEQLSNAGARDIVVLYKAMQFDLGKEKAEKAKTAPVPKIQKPGSSKTKAELQAKAHDDAVRKLKQTGDMEDALKLMSLP